MAMDARDLATYISENKINAEIVHLSTNTPTVETAAQAVGVSQAQIGKSILFMIEGLPILVIANGNSKVSYKRLAQILNTNRRKIKIANSDEVLHHTGFQIGTIPPFGHLHTLNTYVDNRVLEQEFIFAGGGSIDTLVRIEPTEIVRVTDAIRADLQGD